MDGQADSAGERGDRDLVDRAREFAASAHASQKRKHSDAPYIKHLESVVAILQAHGVTAEHVLAAAYLHDTVEDTATDLQDLLDAFGETVAELVYWLTDAERGNRRIRKTMSAWRLGGAPFEAKLIKLADLVDNSGDICRHDPNFAPVYLREKAKILDMMERAEGERLTSLALYGEARRIMKLEDAST